MTVSSYFELYTTFIGWHFFSVVTSLLSKTGVIWLPLILLIVDSVKKARSSMQENAGAVAAYESVETQGFIMLIMMTLVLYPAIPFDAHEVRVSAQTFCSARDVERTSYTTADQDVYPTMRDTVQNDIKVPVWWAVVLGLSGGVTHAVSASLPCSSDLSGLSHSLAQVSINDPELKEEYMRFVNECYVPAQSKIARMENRPAALQQAIADNPGDVYWPGGKALLETKELYPWYQATHPVRGWPFRPDRDKDEVATIDGKLVQSSPWGKPFCKQWWLGEQEKEESGLSSWWDKLVHDDGAARTALANPNVGLRKRLLAYAQEKFDSLDKINVRFSQDVTEAFGDKYGDALIRRMVRQTPGDMTEGSGIADTDEAKAAGGLSTASGAATGVASAVVGGMVGASGLFGGILIGAATIGASILSELAGLYAKIYVLKLGLPFVQALLIMFITAYLPFALVLGSYDLGTIIPASVTLMSVKFFSAIWVILGYLQDSLLSTMFPEEASFVLGADSFSINAILVGLIFGFAHLGAIYVMYKVLAWGHSGSNFGEFDLFGGGDMAGSAKSGGTGGASRASTAARMVKK